MVDNIMNNTKFLLLSTVVEDIRSKCDSLYLSSLSYFLPIADYFFLILFYF